jgi:hypothetical protein
MATKTAAVKSVPVTSRRPRKLVGGLRPPSEPSPQDSIARAKPALEAEHREVGDPSRASCLIARTAPESLAHWTGGDASVATPGTLMTATPAKREVVR